MEYQEYAKELLDYLIINERIGKLIQGNISEIAKGELAVLEYLIYERDGPSAIEISQHFHINTSRVAAILNGLCKKGYIERLPDSKDKRKICVYVTEEGKAFGKNKKDDILHHIRYFLEMLGEDDAKEYLRIMKKVSLIFQNLSSQ